MARRPTAPETMGDAARCVPLANRYADSPQLRQRSGSIGRSANHPPATRSDEAPPFPTMGAGSDPTEVHGGIGIVEPEGDELAIPIQPAPIVEPHTNRSAARARAAPEAHPTRIGPRTPSHVLAHLPPTLNRKVRDNTPRRLTREAHAARSHAAASLRADHAPETARTNRRSRGASHKVVSHRSVPSAPIRHSA